MVLAFAGFPALFRKVRKEGPKRESDKGVAL